MTFIGPSDEMSIADISAFEELSQAIILMLEWRSSVMQSEPMPALARWVEYMQSLPHYHTVHSLLQRVRGSRGPAPSLHETTGANSKL